MCRYPLHTNMTHVCLSLMRTISSHLFLIYCGRQLQTLCSYRKRTIFKKAMPLFTSNDFYRCFADVLPISTAGAHNLTACALCWDYAYIYIEHPFRQYVLFTADELYRRNIQAMQAHFSAHLSISPFYWQKNIIGYLVLLWKREISSTFPMPL